MMLFRFISVILLFGSAFAHYPRGVGDNHPHGAQDVHIHNADFDIPFKKAPGFSPVLKEFQVSDVQLLSGSPAYDGQQVNKQYLHLLDQDRLVHNFLINAGLPSSAQALGGWEGPTCELRGHFTGHFMSAVALASQQYGDAELKTKGDYIVAQLFKAQQAMKTGYLSAFPTSFFDRLESLQNVWAPYYTIHKIMQGLLDMHLLAGNQQAWNMVLDMANYFALRIQNVQKQHGDAQWQRILNTEYGGMPDVMYRIFAITGNATHSWMAHMFDNQAFLGPLAQNKDNLARLHANTHLPQVIGAASRYEVIGDASYRNVTENFWKMIFYHRMYSTGGHNGGNGKDCEASSEYWGLPDCLAKTLTNNNQETCTTYNTLKILKTLIQWSGNVLYMDHYERAYINGILGTSNLPQVGQMLYYYPLATGFSKATSANHWGNQYNSFVCCYGTGVEQWSKMGDSIYFYSANGSNLYVSLYIPSVLKWTAKGVTVTQKSGVSIGDGSATFTIATAKSVTFGLHLHIPFWVAAGGTVAVNGQAVNTLVNPSTIIIINRAWSDGDTVELKIPMKIHAHVMPDNQKLLSVMYGPIVLGGLTATNHTLAINNVNQLESVVTRTSSAPDLKFTAKVENGQTMTMQPLYSILADTKYGVYFNIN